MTIDPTDIDRLTPPELVTLEQPPASKEECIEFLLDVAVEAGRVDDREQALSDLLQREEEATTGVGFGIGIPHAKTSAVTRPSVVFARSEEGIDFDAMDDKPAHLLFMLIVPEEGGEEHLEILSSLSRALMHEEVRESLREAETVGAVRDTLKEAVSG
ncbi:PTS sugar transporter subunit IIA [Salinigranum rubrum]|uniref:PTS sugar transporter subunit IIA n=1 Tax=Salinigranum rubrum TaxID=755307 RepID=UPI0026A53034